MMDIQYNLGVVIGCLESLNTNARILEAAHEIKSYIEQTQIIAGQAFCVTPNKSVELIESIKNGTCFDKKPIPLQEQHAPILKSNGFIRPCDIRVGVRVPRIPTSIEIKYNDDYYAFPISSLEDLEYISEDILLTKKTIGVMIVNKYRKLLQEYDLTLGKYSIDEYPYKNNFIKISKRHYEAGLKGKTALSAVQQKKRMLREI